jgi:hypothetical protein
MFWITLIVSAGIFFVGLVTEKPWLIAGGTAGVFGSLWLMSR